MKKGWLFILFILVAATILVLQTPTLFDEFSGTYISGVGPLQVTMSVDSDYSTCYYTDQSKKQYISGYFIENGDGTYTINCSADNCNVIPTQTIVYSNKQFTLVIDGINYLFQKSSNTPTLFADKQHYD